MITRLKQNNLLLVKIIVLVTIAIPLGIFVYEFIVLGKDSIVFLADYPSAVAFVIMIYYGILLILGITWVVNQLKSILTLRNETKKNELLHLQSQISPHFFFNTLNNLYGLVGKDPKKAQNLILKLSDMMRYSIYEGEREFVTLEEEIVYLENYIELHKMRYHKKIKVVLNTNIQEVGYKLMPLMLIILLENAFKHGVENLRKDAYVTINLANGGNEIHYEVVNNFDATLEPKKTGIGLKNLKRRLELVYPHNHSLSLTKGKDVFKAELVLTQL